MQINNLSHTQDISLRISFGFLLVVVFMIMMIVIGLNNIAQVNSQIKHIVETNNVKIAMANEMKSALYERALSMHSIAVLEDPFLKDEEFLRFNHLGSDYYKARIALEQLVSTPEEFSILVTIRELTRQTQPDVDGVVELGLNSSLNEDNHHTDIFEQIRTQAIPKQRLIQEQVKKLVSLQQAQANSALLKAQSAYTNARNLMVLLGTLATLLVILISSIVIRRVTRQAKQLEHQALHDELTGLANRNLFTDRLKKAVLRGQRNTAPFSIILIDLNRFKIVNDTMGHQVGDMILKEIARRLKLHVRKVDTVARLGGDEFVIILEPLAYQNVKALVEKLTAVIAEPLLLAGQEISIGSSIGIATYPTHGQDCITLIKHADAAMYEAKRSGRANLYYTNKKPEPDPEKKTQV